MEPETNFQTHFRKNYSQVINNTFQFPDKNNIKIYRQYQSIHLDNNRTRTPFQEENKYTYIKRQSSPLEQIRHNRNSKYTSYTHNPFLNIYNRRNKEDNSNNENISNNYIHQIKKTLKNQYNLSDDNLLKVRNSEKQYITSNEQRNSRKSNQLKLEQNITRNNKNNSDKFLINEELNNQTAKNVQTKTTRVLRIKNTENENNKQDESNKRLNLKSIDQQKRNQNFVFYSSNLTHKNDDKKDIRQNDFNNNKLYDSHYSRRNQKETNSTQAKPVININNTKNIKTITSQNSQRKNHTITVIKDNNTQKENNKEKSKEIEKPKEITKTDYRIKKPNIQIKTTYNNSKTTNDEIGEEKDEKEKHNNTMPNLMFSEDNDFGEMKTPIKLSPEIFGQYHPKFKPSTHSLDYEFKNSDELIKAYAYNTCEGNIRDYNEDTITATKINLNPKEKNNYCYFFAIYDGHGGNGCSLYLKNNLHKNITEFSVNGIKSAIELTENNFLTKKAVDYNNNLIDTSGSCGVILLIKNKKFIIANIGDSRLVIFKNKRMIFSTKDHKPNTYLEKRRIELAGGIVYQTRTAIPIYQNGKLIEIPWRVAPGGLSVSRTFGDIESKDERFGGKKGVVVASPDISEFDLNEEYNFIVIGCDGIFDVLSNGEIIECIKIVIKLNKGKNKKINELCADFASMIIKSALAKESFDNVSCVVIVFNLNDFI